MTEAHGREGGSVGVVVETVRAVPVARIAAPPGPQGLDAWDACFTVCRAAIERSAGRRLVVDATEVGDTHQGLPVTLIRLHQSAESGGGRLAVFGLQPLVRSSFELMKLQNVLTIVPDEAEALEAVA